MARWVQHSKNAYSAEELREIEQFVTQARGHITGVMSGLSEGSGVHVTYRLPIEESED